MFRHRFPCSAPLLSPLPLPVPLVPVPPRILSRGLEPLTPSSVLHSGTTPCSVDWRGTRCREVGWVKRRKSRVLLIVPVDGPIGPSVLVVETMGQVPLSRLWTFTPRESPGTVPPFPFRPETLRLRKLPFGPKGSPELTPTSYHSGHFRLQGESSGVREVPRSQKLTTQSPWWNLGCLRLI